MSTKDILLYRTGEIPKDREEHVIGVISKIVGVDAVWVDEEGLWARARPEHGLRAYTRALLAQPKSRDPARIDRILSVLARYWHANPDLRLGQIIANCLPQSYDADPFHFEDTDMEAELKRLSLAAKDRNTAEG